MNELATNTQTDPKSPTLRLEQIVRREFRQNLISLDISESIYTAAGEVASEGERRALLVDVVFEGHANRMLIELPMKKGYKVIFESGIPIRVATIAAHTTLVDNLGNESLGPVYATTIWGDTGERIN